MIEPVEADIGRYVVHMGSSPLDTPSVEAGRIWALGSDGTVFVAFPKRGRQEIAVRGCHPHSLHWLEDMTRQALHLESPPGEPELAAIAERHAATTQGEWIAGGQNVLMACNPEDSGEVCTCWRISLDGASIATGEEDVRANARFIAHAHQDVPRLLAALNTRDSILDDWRKDAGIIGQTTTPADAARMEVLHLCATLRDVLGLATLVAEEVENAGAIAAAAKLYSLIVEAKQALGEQP